MPSSQEQKPLLHPPTTTVYLFSGSKVIAEYDNGAAPSSPTREYIYSGSTLLAKIESGATKYYHPDHLSNRVVTDSSGNSVAQMGTFPFGERWYNSTSDKLLFTSYERDAESGNDYAMARFYVNRLGRFSSPDLLAGSLGDPQSLNRYPYVRNDPIDLTDPLGLTCYTYGFWEIWGDPDTGAIWYTVWDPTFTVCDPKQGGGHGGGGRGGGGGHPTGNKQKQQDCATQLVGILFKETTLSSLVKPGTLNVSVGGGNWVNYSFQATTASPAATSSAILSLTDSNGLSSFQSLSGIRSVDSPSLHVLPQFGNGVIGHVDAWNPEMNPPGHLVEDYLPSKGFGSHPSPCDLLGVLQREGRT